MRKMAETDVFVNVSGQHDNLGDVVLRRKLLESLRAFGKIHLYAGDASSAYIKATIDESRDIKYEEYSAWRRAILKSSEINKVVYVEKPGELQLTLQNIKILSKIVLMIIILRRRRGVALLVGVGTRAKLSTIQKIFMRLMLPAFNVVLWRDTRTFAELPVGRVMPDWAFGYGGDLEGADARLRNQLIVSLRVDRPFPSAEWIEAVRTFAATKFLNVVIVCQVARDLPRCNALVEVLNAEMLPWNDDFDKAEVELRALYRRTALAISDRLHVLILAATEGAPPACMTEFDEAKVGRHFDAIAFGGSSRNVAGLHAAQMGEYLQNQFDRRSELLKLIPAAQAAVSRVEQEISEAINVASAN